MTRHIWRAADAGVMLWEPATEATTTTAPQEPHPLKESRTVTQADIQATLASSHNNDDSDAQELVLPSVEDVFGPYIKSEPEEDVDLKTPSDTSGYASSSTQLPPTPCPLHSDRAVPTMHLDSANPSHQLGTGVRKRKRPVRRTLEFAMVTRRDTVDVEPQRTELSNLGSLAALRKLERDPPHQWDEDERELLTILYRWYEDTDVTTLPRIFNAITGLDLRLSVVRYQFESHLILYGGRAYPEFDRVMKVPFHDPEQQYDDIHTIIEETASECGIGPSRRKVEVKHKSGLAKHAKSPTTRKYYKSLVRRAVKREKERSRALRMPVVEELPMRTLPLGGVTLATDPRQENEESWSDTENQSTPQISPAESQREASTRAYSIAFRAYDESSFTTYSEENGFMSSKFHCWPRGKPIPPPLDPNGEMRPYLMVDANNHLSMSGGTSPFITVCTSLLQTLVKASNMQNPRIAVVALDHPILQQPNKVLHAAEVLLMLKAEGLAKWARYKGHAERMVWGSIPRAAIISHLPLSDLQDLANSDETCANLLALQEFQNGRTTKHVSTRLRNNNVVLKRNIARRIAAIARTFHMDDADVSLVHIQDFVARFVDGWKINENPLNGTDASSRIAAAFATTLASRAHRVQDIMKAFQDGIQHGAESIAYYSRRRLTTRHPRAS